MVVLWLDGTVLQACVHYVVPIGKSALFIAAVISTPRLPRPPLMRSGCSFCDVHLSI